MTIDYVTQQEKREVFAILRKRNIDPPYQGDAVMHKRKDVITVSWSGVVHTFKIVND